jgi:hypothetical protein
VVLLHPCCPLQACTHGGYGWLPRSSGSCCAVHIMMSAMGKRLVSCSSSLSHSLALQALLQGTSAPRPPRPSLLYNAACPCTCRCTPYVRRCQKRTKGVQTINKLLCRHMPKKTHTHNGQRQESCDHTSAADKNIKSTTDKHHNMMC